MGVDRDLGRLMVGSQMVAESGESIVEVDGKGSCGS